MFLITTNCILSTEFNLVFCVNSCPKGENITVIIISVVTIQTTRVQNIVSLKTKRDLATPVILQLPKKQRKEGKCP